MVIGISEGDRYRFEVVLMSDGFIVRARAIYQTALETGRSAEEMGDAAAAREIAALWDYVEAATPSLADEDRQA